MSVHDARQQVSRAIGPGEKLVGYARFNLSQLGRRIAYVRKLKRITQKDLAELVGVRRTMVARWEWGANLPCLNRLAAVADACDTTIPYLLGYEGYDEPLRVFTGEIPLRKTGKTDVARGLLPKVSKR
jgi:DNA-binding XRE family transcriptional regulator